MIVICYRTDDEITFVTNGCGCCSKELYYSRDDSNDEIINHLKENISVVKRGCELLGIDYNKFINNEV